MSTHAFGIGDWRAYTPGGNYFDDPGDGPHLWLRSQPQELRDVRCWYFYRNRIMGKINKAFFIANDSSGALQLFADSASWRQTVQTRHLVPRAWTRWHAENWRSSDTWPLLLIFGWWLMVPLLVLFGYVVYGAIQARFALRNQYVLIVLAILILLGSRLLLDNFPRSI